MRSPGAFGYGGGGATAPLAVARRSRRNKVRLPPISFVVSRKQL